MTSISDNLIKLQDLTQTNLEILQAINDSFFTKKDHLLVNVGNNRYAMPSFISLENKLNSLTANFQNLINSPESGEAYFNFDGNSRSIQVRPYTQTPNSLILDTISNFGVEQNDIFKDFMTPNPYININVQSLPNDITSVVVKKIIPIHNDLINMFTSLLEVNSDSPKTSIKYSYKDIYKKLINYKQDIDYIEYDSKIDLPIRKNIGSGIWVVKEILEDIVDENLDNYITVKLRSDLTESIYSNSLKYRLFDETIERPLKIGDQITTYDGTAKLEVVEVRSNTNVLVLKVLHGEYLNLIPDTSSQPSQISSLSKLRFFSPIDFDEDKYVKIPIEEDRFVFISVAALNNRMNVQSSWGSGLMIDTHSLTMGDSNFKDYYNANVKNVGDILFEMVTMMQNILTSYSTNQYKTFKELRPVINVNNISVMRINEHLNNSSSIQNIRSLYTQKQEHQTRLTEVREEIQSIKASLASLSSDDMNDIRSSYNTTLQELISSENELTSAILKITNEISRTANDSEVPIENAKYRIRGFYDYKDFLKSINRSDLIDHVRGIEVQYRYKNPSKEQGSSVSINGKFLFSDWNRMSGFNREKISKSENNKYTYSLQEMNDNLNEPSFNQIDIPITQGEIVDIKLKLVWDFGWPLVYVDSDWSDIVTISFPEQYLKDVRILDIIEENNNDIETNRFQNILKESGAPEHINDNLIDRGITYYHKADNISSGFYTAERRIIPLKDKLINIDSELSILKDEVFGTHAENLKVSLKHGANIVDLIPLQNRNLVVEQYSTFNISNSNNLNNFDGLYMMNDKVITTIINISLLNNSDHSVKLYSMFPGDRDTTLYYNKSIKFNKNDYVGNSGNQSHGVWMEYPDTDGLKTNIQGGNQFVYFRVNNINTGIGYYDTGDQSSINNKLSLQEDYIKYDTNKPLTGTSAWLYPKISNKYSLCLDDNSIGNNIIIKPYEEIIIPVIFEYYVKEGETINKTMSFDIMPSLYKDPISYNFTITAKYSNTPQDKLVINNIVKTQLGNTFTTLIR